jgi:hypothetical protein
VLLVKRRQERPLSPPILHAGHHRRACIYRVMLVSVFKQSTPRTNASGTDSYLQGSSHSPQRASSARLRRRQRGMARRS